MQYLYKNCPAPAKRGLERGTRFTKCASVDARAELRSLPAFVMAVTLVACLFARPASAQVLKRPHEDQPTPDQNQTKINAKSPKKYPRAIGVIEFLPGGAARLVPVALWIDDHFYDASLYGANPAPMAVEPDTVYEATNYGERLGLFTVTNPQEFKGSWIAAGKWKPRQALDEKLAADAAKQPKLKPKTTDMDDDRPTLKRPGEGGSSSSGGTASGTGAASSGGGSGSSGGNGTGSSNGGSASSGRSSSGTPPAADDDPNRPTLKKPVPPPSAPPASQSSPSTQAASGSSPSSGAVSPDENDPNRPLLRRGKPEGQSAVAMNASIDDLEAPKPNPATGKSGTNVTTITHSYPAVSDAGPFETRSLLYAMNDTERASKTEQMSALALDEIRKFIAQRHTPGLPATAAITSSDLRSYDLDYHNNPTIVFTAALPVAGAKAFRSGDFSYFVTIVAHEDFNGQPVKIFSAVTDSNHLDAFPRMEIIDAVDADANGRGDLLFRQFSDTGISYSLFRVFPYDMQKIFEGGAGA